MFGSLVNHFDMQRSAASISDNTSKNIYLPKNAPRRVWELDEMASEQAVEIEIGSQPKKSQESVAAAADKGLSVCKAG